MKQSWLIAICACFFVSNIAAKEIETEVTGYGTSIDEAIQDALVRASSSVNGVDLTSKTSLNKQLVKENKKLSTSKELLSSSNISSKGSINSYEVLDTQCDDGKCEVTLSILIEKFVQKNKAVLDKKSKIAVIPFSGNPIFSKRVQNALTDQLVQSRRFVTLDRQNSNAYEKEYRLWKGKDVSTNEKVKLGQGFGLDFMIIGEIQSVYAKTYTKVVGASKLTGEKGTVVKYGKTYARVRVQVVELATKQIKFSDNFTVGLNENNAQKAANIISKKISDQVIQNIYPMRVISVQGDTVILNQGGKGIYKGSLYDLFALGEKLVDPYTGELLGRIENKIALIKITKVTSKISYAQVIKGDLNKIKVKFIVRKHVRVTPLKQKSMKKKVPPVKTTTITPEVGGVIF